MAGSLIISGGQVWQGADRGFEQQDLVIRDGLVTDTPAPDGACEELDARGKWVLPGFIDAHFHAYATSMDGLENELGPLSYTAINATRRLTRALRRGFTTVRDVAGGDIGLARAIDAELFCSPRYLFTGPALSQTGGHGDPRAQHIDVCFSHGHMCEIADGVEALRVAVRNRIRTGAHAIKIMTSGGVFSLTDPIRIPQYSPEEIQVTTAEAARYGSYVAAHAYSAEAVVHSVENGVRSIEHGNLIDRPAAKMMAQHRAFLVPTLAAYDAMDRRGEQIGLNEISLAKNSEVLTHGKDAIRLALEAGVRVGFGTDLMGDLEDDQLRGIQLQVEAAGALETIRSMTETNAALLQDNRLGSLAPGSAGDAVVLSDNPLQTADVLWDEGAREHVVLAGSVV